MCIVSEILITGCPERVGLVQGPYVETVSVVRDWGLSDIFFEISEDLTLICDLCFVKSGDLIREGDL